MPDPNRRLLAWALTLAPLGALLRSTPSHAQSPIVQPTEQTKAGFLEHARGLRDQAVRDACRRLKMRDLSDCEVYSTATPCPMCQAALYWARVRRYHNDSTSAEGVAPRLTC